MLKKQFRNTKTKDYKAVPYSINNPSTSEQLSFFPVEPVLRWKIVHTRTGKVLDDANGYGYKSPSSAYRAYGHKEKAARELETQIRHETRIKNWFKINSDFQSRLDHADFDFCKNLSDIPVSESLVSHLLEELYLNPPFSAKDIFDVWKALPPLS